MKNPYTVLGISQDSSKGEIVKAQRVAMMKKEFPIQTIAVAVKQLLDPAKRLACDFMFPAKIKVKRIKPIQSTLSYKEINTDKLDKNAFNSLN